MVTTLAGSGVAGSYDLTGTSASFNDPVGVCADAAGNVYVADQSNHKIRKITPAGVVSTFAGTGGPGSADLIGTSATFSYPGGICTDATGNFYVADVGNHRIRKIAVISTNLTETTMVNTVIQLYPNPSSTSLTIQTSEMIESVNIYNSLGSLIQIESNTTFSVEQLASGIYTIQVKTIKGTGTTRFVKN